MWIISFHFSGFRRQNCRDERTTMAALNNMTLSQSMLFDYWWHKYLWYRICTTQLQQPVPAESVVIWCAFVQFAAISTDYFHDQWANRAIFSCESERIDEKLLHILHLITIFIVQIEHRRFDMCYCLECYFICFPPYKDLNCKNRAFQFDKCEIEVSVYALWKKENMLSAYNTKHYARNMQMANRKKTHTRSAIFNFHDFLLLDRKTHNRKQMAGV